jgi:uncharacterized membrane protein (GlpM family)
MGLYITKTLISALVIVLVTEVSKRSGYVGGLIKSLPLISLISFVMLYLETKDTSKVAVLSVGTFWFVLPTLPLFLVFPYLLRQDYGFWLSLSLSIILMIICYLITMFLLNRLGVTL